MIAGAVCAGLMLAQAPGSGALELVHEDPLQFDFQVEVSCEQSPPRPDERFWYSKPDEWAFRPGIGDNGLGEPVEDAGPCLTFKSSKAYKPRVRSPHSLALLRGHDMRGCDFAFEVEAMQTGIETPHRDLVLVFGFESPERYFYAHLGMVPDATSSNVFEVDGAPRARVGEIGERRIAWGRGVWRQLRVECVGRTARVFLDGAKEPHFEEVLRREPTGLIGFGSFDDAGAFRNLRVYQGAPREEGTAAAGNDSGTWLTSPFGGVSSCRSEPALVDAGKRTVTGQDGAPVAAEILRVDAGRHGYEIVLADADGDGSLGSAGDRWALRRPSSDGAALRSSEMLPLAEGVLIDDDLTVKPNLDGGTRRWARPFEVTLVIPSAD